MSNRIIVLDDILASKIAAGEVVERPASIVKELVENSLDAGATVIEAEIHNGGKSLIRITDNGHGMSPSDAKLCLERHATSKIRKADDLFNISTLGFRGEALPSIASVSLVELLTSDGELGTKLIVEGGKLVSAEELSLPRGTTVIVKDIFFNTPARLKFLKSDGTELSHIEDVIAKAALARPDVSFKLTANGKELLSTSGNGSLRDAVACVYGNAFVKNLVGVKGKGIAGFVSKPGETKHNREYQVFFVNGRLVRNFMLSKVLESAFDNMIPKDRHPAAVIFIDADPRQIDVNVHPQKKEIKFLNPSMIGEALRESVKDSLADCAAPVLVYDPISAKESRWTQQAEQVLIENFKRPEIPSSVAVTEEKVLPVFPVAQLDNTYIVCLDGPDLVLIDQHAAHERILYEKLKASSSSGSMQTMLIPEVLELTPQEFRSMSSNLGLLSSVGFDIEPFGKDSVRIKAIPADIKAIAMKELIADIASEISGPVPSGASEEAKDKLRKLAACHGAIKAGDPLSTVEINALVRDLFSTTSPSTCPHGRPSVIRLPGGKIASFFGRNK